MWAAGILPRLLPKVKEINIDSEPKTIQHCSPTVTQRKQNVSIYQAWDENGRLQAGRAVCVNKKVFEKATYFGKIETCHSESEKEITPYSAMTVTHGRGNLFT
jgi:hypothetical protein